MNAAVCLDKKIVAWTDIETADYTSDIQFKRVNSSEIRADKTLDHILFFVMTDL